MADALHRNRLVSVTLDEVTLGPANADQAQERRTAIYDLLESNSFTLVGRDSGPYAMTVRLHGGQLALDIRTEAGDPVVVHVLSLRQLRSLLRDYMMLCDAYVAAIRSAGVEQIQSIDMGRRGLHNEGAERLAERLAGKIVADFDTMRRLFTLLTALHWKG